MAWIADSTRNSGDAATFATWDDAAESLRLEIETAGEDTAATLAWVRDTELSAEIDGVTYRIYREG